MALEKGRDKATASPVGSSPGGKRRSHRAIVALAGVAAALLVFVLYLRTLAPTVLYYHDPDMLDAVMLQMQAAVLANTHPTGYPTYLMLTHLFTYLPFGDVGYRTNLASAAYAALAVLAVYAAGYLLSRRVVAAATGAVAFGLGQALWSQAVIAEVYTLNALLIALTIVALLLWRESRRDRYLLLSAFLVGLCLTHHMTSGLLLPALFLFVALVDWRKFLKARLVLGGAGLFLLGLTPYLYLPVRAWMDPPMEANNPSNFERFWYVVSGGNLRRSFFAFGPEEFPGRVAFYLDHLLGNMHFLLVMVAFTGALLLLFRDRAVGVLLGFLYFGWAFYSIENDIPDIDLYFIPTYLVLALWAAVGVGALLAEAEVLASRFPRAGKTAVIGALSAVILAIPLLGVGETYAKRDRSEDYQGRRILDTVAEKTAPNATVLHHRSGLWYLVLVEKRRRDLTLVDPFPHNIKVEYADLVWPADLNQRETARRFGTDDFTGVTAAKIAAKKGRVYITDQGKASPQPFLKAGFDIVRVDKSILYELVPPGKEPYTDK